MQATTCTMLFTHNILRLRPFFFVFAIHFSGKSWKKLVPPPPFFCHRATPLSLLYFVVSIIKKMYSASYYKILIVDVGNTRRQTGSQKKWWYFQKIIRVMQGDNLPTVLFWNYYHYYLYSGIWHIVTYNLTWDNKNKAQHLTQIITELNHIESN